VQGWAGAALFLAGWRTTFDKGTTSPHSPRSFCLQPTHLLFDKTIPEVNPPDLSVRALCLSSITIADRLYSTPPTDPVLTL
jgi:hypothetical protein